MSKLSVTPNGLMQKPLKASDPLVPKSLVQLEKDMESIADGHGVVPEYLEVSAMHSAQLFSFIDN